jgi:hypothetical protein
VRHRTHQFFALPGYSGGYKRVIRDNPESFGARRAFTKPQFDALRESAGRFLESDLLRRQLDERPVVGRKFVVASCDTPGVLVLAR